MISLLPWLDFIGIAVAAASGALAAARKNMDLGGFAFTSAAAGLAGGTMRDLLLNRPVLWIERPSFLVVCLATAFVLFFAAHHLQSRERYYLWADALALGLFSVTGTGIALNMGAHGAVAVVMGVLTSTFGGIVRDILCAEVPLILRKEIYALAAAAGGVVMITAHDLGLIQVAALAGFAVTFAVRGFSLLLGWSLPVYGRDS